MDTHTIAIVLAILTAAVGATWQLSNVISALKFAAQQELASLAKAFAVHAQKDEDTHEELKARVVKLEGRRARR